MTTVRGACERGVSSGARCGEHRVRDRGSHRPRGRGRAILSRAVRMRAHNSTGECHLCKVEVGGSNPPGSTTDDRTPLRSRVTRLRRGVCLGGGGAGRAHAGAQWSGRGAQAVRRASGRTGVQARGMRRGMTGNGDRSGIPYRPLGPVLRSARHAGVLRGAGPTCRRTTHARSSGHRARRPGDVRRAGPVVLPPARLAGAVRDRPGLDRGALDPASGLASLGRVRLGPRQPGVLDMDAGCARDAVVTSTAAAGGAPPRDDRALCSRTPPPSMPR
jgi:hypothetical protein